MWPIAISALIFALFICAYLYWRVILKPHIPRTLCCFLIHDVVSRPSYRSASEISIRQFRLFIDEAISSGLRFVAPDALLSRDNRNEIMLTFDDGFDSVYHNVYPILKEKQVPALIFTVGDYSGESPSWDYHNSGRRHLTQDQIGEMQESGLVTIGSHSATHPDLTRVSEKRLHDELRRSNSGSTRCFSYPFGRFNGAVVEAAEREGYDAAFCSLNGAPKRWNQRHAIPRFPLNRFDNRFTIRTKLSGGKLYWCEILKARIIGLFAPLTYDWQGRP
jgi:peptidoglycan/xylan/chitin deacetylase (PgdA/CDA1 family)